MATIQQTCSSETAVGRIGPAIRGERCKGCGICTAFCPPKILVLSDHFNPRGYPEVKITDAGACRGCLQCCLMCPDVVFAFAQKDDTHASDDERE